MLKHKEQGVTSQGGNKSENSFKSNNRITPLINVFKMFYGNEIYNFHDVCRQLYKW